VFPARFEARAREILRTLPKKDRDRIELLEGDVASMDLGLSGAEFNRLAEEVTLIHHCAAICYLGTHRKIAKRVNLGGAREVIELAKAASHLNRLVHWSTTRVSGCRRGFVLEEELDGSAGFNNAIEETRHRAERIIRSAAEHLPVTVLRPSTMVGDSTTGEIDRFEGPYLLVLLMLSSPAELRIPMPGKGTVPLNLVPIDYVVRAGLAVADKGESLGRTFHIVDPDPLTARGVFERIAEATGRPLPRGFLPTNVATALLRTPGVERFAHVPKAFLEQMTTEVVYDDRNTKELLDGTGIHCPSFESYVQTMVDFVRQQQAEERAKRRGGDDYDPLESAP